MTSLLAQLILFLQVVSFATNKLPPQSAAFRIGSQTSPLAPSHRQVLPAGHVVSPLR